MANLSFADEYNMDVFIRKIAMKLICNKNNIKRDDPEYMIIHQKLRNEIPKADSSLKEEILDYIEKINVLLVKIARFEFTT